MRVGVNLGSLRSTHLHDYAIRFVFGGMITVIAGLVARKWGASAGGLLLAFPAIFPASATLLEKHQTDRKHQAGKHGSRRGREAAALDAVGASLGCIGLAAFGLTVWLWLPGHSSPVVLVSAGGIWLAVSLGAWRLWEMR